MSKPLAFALLVAVTACGGSRPSRGRQAPVVAAAPAPGPAAPRPARLDEVYAKALDGDMRAGVELLRAIPLETLDDGEREQRACLLGRFGAAAGARAASPSGGSPFVDEVIHDYQDYWRRSLLKELDPPAAEALLATRLAETLARGQPRSEVPAQRAPAWKDELADRLGKRLEAEGVHSLRGMTLPYHELMAWRSETPTTYEVALPDGVAHVKVVLLRHFVSLGWSAFATCDRSYTGGWAAADRLYCVADSYDLESEHFRVSYLAHEAQHFRDYETFPKLAQPELEYRGKLVEIMESRTTTRALVGVFVASAIRDRKAPHSFAEWALVRDLVEELHLGGPHELASVSDEQVRRAATSLFRSNSARLTAQGRRTVETILGD